MSYFERAALVTDEPTKRCVRSQLSRLDRSKRFQQRRIRRLTTNPPSTIETATNGQLHHPYAVDDALCDGAMLVLGMALACSLRAGLLSCEWQPRSSLPPLIAANHLAHVIEHIMLFRILAKASRHRHD